jgi:NADH-quinone oxidoreductase subunit L
MTRLVVLTFFGDLRLGEAELHHLPHGRPVESPAVMTVPLVALAALSALGGLVGVPEALGGSNRFHGWLAGLASAHGGAVAEAHAASHAGPFGEQSEYLAMGFTMALVLASAGLAWVLYSRRLPDLSARSARLLEGRGLEGGLAAVLYRAINAKYYVDELYDRVIVRPIRYGSRDYLWPFDKWVIDGAVNGIADVVKAGAAILAFLQNGNVKRYLVGMAFGVVVLVLLLTLALPALATGGGL